MERIHSLIERKREILRSYREKFKDLPQISMNPEPDGTINGAWMPTVVFSQESGITREKIQAVFISENIDARVFFWPLSSLDFFESSIENINAWSIPERAINIPSYHELTNLEIERISQILISALN
jgi:perosamine synthetase